MSRYQLTSQRLVRLAALLLSATLLGCAERPTRPPVVEVPAAAEPAAETPAALQGQASALLAEAELRQYPDNLPLILDATELLLQVKDTAAARNALDRLPRVRLPEPLQTRAVLDEAELLLLEGKSLEARERLASLSIDMPLDLLIRYHQLRATSYSQTGHHLEAARERIWLDGLLSGEAQAENQRAIWQALNHLSNTALVQLRIAPPPDVLSGWMELVLMTRTHGDDQDALQLALADWRRRFPAHPADLGALQPLFAQTLKITPHPEHIAVLLPLSGNLQSVGEAIRDGLLASYYDNGASGELRFYDTAADPLRIWSLYQEAIQAGAQAVIGPLTKPAVNELARTGLLTVPVLALNRAEGITDFPDGLYQFALAPEDEAEQVATAMHRRGQRRAVVMAPDNAWGDRMLFSFQARWEALGGTLLEVHRYGRETRDYSRYVEELLNIDDSEARHQRLTRLLGMTSEFEPRRRQDLDAIVLFANPEAGRLLRPLLKFHRASDVPVYSTSHVFTGVSEPRQDADLNGLMFCDTPWLLDPDTHSQRLIDQLSAAWPNTPASLKRLQAFGIDAFDLLPYLGELSSGQRVQFSGITGQLTLNDQRQVQRSLIWARFQNGIPQLLAPIIQDDAPVSLRPRLKEERDVWQLPIPTPPTGPAS